MKAKIYTTQYCPYCAKAKSLLTSLDIAFEDFDVGEDQELRQKMIDETGHMTVPIIFIDDKFIGGYDDLVVMHQKGELS